LRDRSNGNFNDFKKDWVIIRAIERELEIIGEAVNKITKIDPGIHISSAKNIIGLRNIIIHSYDTVDNGMLWGVINKDIPILNMEIEKLRR